MLTLHFILFLSTTLSYADAVLGLGTACSTPLGGGKAAPMDPFWMQNIKHQGISAHHPNPRTYQVFRNVLVRETTFLGLIMHITFRTSGQKVMVLPTTLQPSSVLPSIPR